MEIDVLYTIWMNDRSSATIDAEDEVIVDRAMKLWADSRRDSWIELRQPAGCTLAVLASTITSASRSTAEQRVTVTLREKLLGDEVKQNRSSAGLPPEE